MLDHLRAMAVFATVAETGSFSGAARKLGLSASVVSHHVTVLERHLDTPLLYRTTRRLSLTDAGRKLAGSANDMLAAAEQGFGLIGQQSDSPTGSLKITAPAVLQYARFITRLSTFAKHFPRVEISISFSDRRLNLVAEGYDLAFRIGELEDSTLIARKLVDGQQVLCASPGYLKAAGAPTQPADLTRLEMIAGPSPRLELQSREGRAKRTVRIPHRLSVDSGFAAMRMAEEGCGVAMLPDFLARKSIDSGTLVEVLPEWRLPSFGIHAVWPDNPGTHALRTRLVDFVALIARTDGTTDREMIDPTAVPPGQ